MQGFQSTRPLRGATYTPLLFPPISGNFNPRAPCGARQGGPYRHQPGVAISIHAPLAGRDSFRPSWPQWPGHFNPRAPCGARLPPGNPWSRRPAHFNPRAPCGARPTLRKSTKRYLLFQSTRPLRGATARVGQLLLAGEDFNPRAPCGARQRRVPWRGNLGDFNPRAPCGARPVALRRRKKFSMTFQSTRPLRGATRKLEL